LRGARFGNRQASNTEPMRVAKYSRCAVAGGWRRQDVQHIGRQRQVLGAQAVDQAAERLALHAAGVALMPAWVMPALISPALV
jgi:hypothetical protein